MFNSNYTKNRTWQTSFFKEIFSAWIVTTWISDRAEAAGSLQLVYAVPQCANPPSYAYVDIEISMIKKIRQFTEWPLAIPVNLSFANFTFNSVKREKSRLTLNRAISSQYRVTGTHSEFFPQTPFRSFFRIIFETFLCILWSPPCEEVPAYRLLAGKQPAIVKVVHFSSESDTVFSNKVGEKTYMWHPRRT